MKQLCGHWAKPQLDPAPTGHIIAPRQWRLLWNKYSLVLKEPHGIHSTKSEIHSSKKLHFWKSSQTEKFTHCLHTRHAFQKYMWPTLKNERMENNLKNDYCSYLLKNYNNMIAILFLVMAGILGTLDGPTGRGSELHPPSWAGHCLWTLQHTREETGVGTLYWKGRARSNHAGFSHSCCSKNYRTQQCFSTTQEPHVSPWLLFSYFWSLPF